MSAARPMGIVADLTTVGSDGHGVWVGVHANHGHDHDHDHGVVFRRMR